MTSSIHPLIVKRIAWPDESATLAFARSVAERREISDVLVELRGDLGAGKTSFARHLLAALGVTGRIKSPTYAVVECYSLPRSADSDAELNIWHFDFYRFTDPEEWEDAGFRDLFASPGLKLVEWPEKAGDHLPQPDLRIDISVAFDSSREVALSAYSRRGAALIA